jgi:hypothetical protein
MFIGFYTQTCDKIYSISRKQWKIGRGKRWYNFSMVGYDLEYLLLKEDMPNYHHQFFNLFISHVIIRLSERFGWIFTFGC